MPYDIDGTVVVYGAATLTSLTQAFANGPLTYVDSASMIELNDGDFVALPTTISIPERYWCALWFFFCERREVTGIYYGGTSELAQWGANTGMVRCEGSTDSTTGVDGTWEVASLPGGLPATGPGLDRWRANIKAVSFTGPKSTVRICGAAQTGYAANAHNLVCLHLYGEKAAGQTPDDLIFLNGLTSYAEFAAPEDFGDVPLATSSVRTFKVKNASATKTANTITLQCNDSDFVISTDNVTWVATINISSLAAGASSGVMYVRNTSPAIGSPLGPRFARIVATVASYT